MSLKLSAALVTLGTCTGALAYAQSIFKVVPTPNGHHGVSNNALWSAAASAPSDIWAVGQTTIHFDGAQWTAFTAPLIKGDNTSLLTGVADISPTEAWAVGYINQGLANPAQIIEQWNGVQWTQYPNPPFNPGDHPSLNGISAVSSTDIWAVGTLLAQSGGTDVLEALYEHWDGTAWTKQTGHFNGFLERVSADAPNDIWAVGFTTGNTTFSEHYDGTSWKLVRTPNVGTGPNYLWDVTALAPNNVWAVGYSTASNTPPPGMFDVPTKTLIEHYDGTAWSVVPSPNVGPNSQFQSNQLRGITAVSPNDIWAFGSYFAADGSGQQATLLLHWDGNSWTLQPSPSPKPGNFMSDVLDGGVAPSPGNVWIFGSEDPATTGRPVTVTLTLHTSSG